MDAGAIAHLAALINNPDAKLKVHVLDNDCFLLIFGIRPPEDQVKVSAPSVELL